MSAAVAMLCVIPYTLILSIISHLTLKLHVSMAIFGQAVCYREATSSAAAAVMLELLARSSSSSRLEHTPFRDMQHPKSRGCLYGVKKNYYA